MAINGVDWLGKVPHGGTYTATADDATANKIEIDTGKKDAVGFFVQVFRSDIETTASAKISMTAGVISVEDNSSTWVITDGDVINWIVF